MRGMRTAMLLPVLVSLACSISTGSYTTHPSYTRKSIFVAEIEKSSATNAYELISNLRPHWLKGRGPKSIVSYAEASYPVVYVNGNRYGGQDSLGSISVANITGIRFLSAGDATTKYGIGHSGGAIEITIF